MRMYVLGTRAEQAIKFGRELRGCNYRAYGRHKQLVIGKLLQPAVNVNRLT